MKNIIISEKVSKAIPNLQLGVISADVSYSDFNKDLWAEIEQETVRIRKMTTEEIKLIPQILSTREAYKALGKEPSRYRPSAEALHRRLIKGNDVYQISNLVDTINLSSLITGYSIGGYDETTIQGEIIFDSGDAKTKYQAIGRGIMNIEKLPVFYDEKGAFGSPTSDSTRTMTSEKTTKLLLIVLNLGGHPNFEDELEIICDKIIKYCGGRNIETKIL
jgi:DNA/RNA-binding domain of Phe-tRNA-synthetase-like protein